MELNFAMPPLWMDDALCSHGGIRDDLWFPTDGAYISREAHDICGRCPVKKQCLDYATEHRLEGVWGGTSYAYRRHSRHAASGPCAIDACDETAPAQRLYCSAECASQGKSAKLRAYHVKEDVA